MTYFMQQALSSAAGNAPTWLSDVIEQGRAQWQHATWPTRKTEHWKYTPLGTLQKLFTDADVVQAKGQTPGIAELPKLSDTRLVFVDGHYQAALSSIQNNDGIQLVRFSDANSEQAERIKQHLGTTINSDKHLFAKLNSATLSEGLMIDLRPDAAVESPIHLLWMSSDNASPRTITQRVLILAGAHSRSTVIEHFANANSESQVFTNGITELILEQGARLDYYRLNLEEGATVHLAGVHARLASNACLNSFTVAIGSRLKRLDIVVNHAGPGAHCELNGVYLPRGKEHVDFHTCIEHAVPRCTTDENFRGIVADEATAVFNGRIHIHPNAQQTRAELSNKNLITSNRAEVNTKPELEIYADDVQCAHGATVAQLDHTSLHYLRSRGVSRAEAEVLLSFGFINELVNGIRLEVLRDYLRPILAGRFASKPDLARHLL